MFCTWTPLAQHILGFHMTSRPPCPDPILWELTSIIMQAFSFAFIEKMAVEHVSETQEHNNYNYFLSMQIGLMSSLSNVNSKEYLTSNEALRANLHGNKRILKWPPFWNKVYKLGRNATKGAYHASAKPNLPHPL